MTPATPPDDDRPGGPGAGANRLSPESTGPRPSRPTPEAATDLALVRAFLAGEPGAERALADRLTILPRILKVLNNRAGRPLDEHDLLDLAQDTGVVLLTKLGRFDGRVALDGYIYGVCRFEFLNASRRRRRRPRPTEEIALEETAAGEQQATELVRLADDIEAGLAALAEDERGIIRLKHFDDLTFEAIGDRLGCSPNTAKTRYYRGLKKLRAFMEPRKREYLP